MIAAELITGIELGCIYGITAIGIYLSFRIINFPDLTCDGSFATGAVVCATSLQAGMNPWFTLLLSLGIGSITGLITGLLATYGRITQTLAGILVAFMLYSINLRIMGGIPNIALINQTTIFSTQIPWLIIGAIVISVWLISSYLFSTDLGLALRSIGQNSTLAQALGIRPSLMTIGGLVLSNGLISLSGGLICHYQNFADISQGIGTLIVALAAVIIGEKIVPNSSLSAQLAACIFGSIVYRLAITCALHSEWLGLQTSDLNLLTGLLVIIIMWLPTSRGA